MKNTLDTVKKWFIHSFWVLALPGITLLGQEEGDDAGGGDDAAGGDAGGGGSAAEAAVTSGGSAQPAAAASGSIESNPVVTLVRAGLNFQSAKSIKISDIIKIASAGGSITKLISIAKAIENKNYTADDLVFTLDLGLGIDNAENAAKEANKEGADSDYLDNLSKNLKSGFDLQDILDGKTEGIDNALLDSALALIVNPYHSSIENLKEATREVVLGSTGFTNFQTYLESAVTFANTVLTDVTITSEDHFPEEISVKSLTDSPQTLEFIRLLGKYGAIGSDASALSDTLAGAFFGTDFASSTKMGTSLLSFLGSNTSGHVGQLKTSLGTRTLPSGVQDSTVLQIKMSNVALAPGANITVGASGSTSTIDVSDVLTKANSNEERKVAILGAAKDLTIAGDVTFTNTNTVEDHALVLGAADDLQLRGQDKDYVENEKVTLTYTGSNLGLGSNDTMRLINVDIKTGGNLAIGTLDQLYVGSGSIKDGGDQGQTHGINYSTTNGTSKFEVGVEDNVYLYANNLISINGLEFGSGMDDIYMDAITIDLSNVTFPQNSDVMLRSRDGSMQFGATDRTVGSVNFIQNVKYGATAIESAGQFNGKDGHWDSTDLTLPNGKSAIKVRGF
jgi:hypothetical protein